MGWHGWKAIKLWVSLSGLLPLLLMAGPGRAAPYLIRALIEEQYSAGDSHISLLLFAEQGSPMGPKVLLSPPTFTEFLPHNSFGQWQFDFDTFDEVSQFLTGEWDIQYSTSFPYPHEVEDYRLTVDPLVLPEGARSLAEFTTPLDGTRVRSGEWFDVAWTFPDGAPPGVVSVFSHVNIEGDSWERELNLLGASGSGSRQHGPDSLGRFARREHRYYQVDDATYNLEFMFTSEGYVLPVPIGISVGSVTLLGISDGEFIEGPSPAALEISLAVQYSFHPDPDVHIYLVPAPLAADYNEDGVVDAADYTVWRNNLGSAQSLPNDDTPGVDVDDYTRWKTHFGQSVSASLEAGAKSVPEPQAMTITALLVASSIRFLRKNPRLR